MKFFNTLGRNIQEFEPIDPSNVRMYTCGPTVYNYAHIGNFRAYLFEDLLRRTLEYHGYKVTQVMNLTDVDDKTIRDSRAGNLPLREFTAIYKKAFFEDLDKNPDFLLVSKSQPTVTNGYTITFDTYKNNAVKEM